MNHQYTDLQSWDRAVMDYAGANPSATGLTYLATDTDALTIIRDLTGLAGGELQSAGTRFGALDEVGQWRGVAIYRGAEVSHFAADEVGQ